MTEEQRQEMILKYGAHNNDDADCCAVEWAHLQRGKPKQANALADESYVLVRALISFNDSFPNNIEGDVERTKFCGPLLPKLAGSRRTFETEMARSLLAADWFVRIYIPLMLEGLTETKEVVGELRALQEIKTAEQLLAALPLIEKANRAARAALDARAALAALDARAALAALDARAALAALDARAARAALDARAALAALDARAALAALAALDARAARAARDAKQNPVAAAKAVYVEMIAKVRASEVELLERMFALKDPPKSEG